MKLDDIANLLAEKINQPHYIKHYLSNVFIEGLKKGMAENSDSFAIGFYEWRSTTRIKNIDQYTNNETLEMYKKHLKDMVS
jgi:hypothetical protein